MKDERLLERIRNQEEDPGRRSTQDKRRLVASVLKHLQRILNTRQGSVVIAEDFGLPDITNFPSAYSADTLRDLEQAIRQVIMKYEPRLTGLRVGFAPSEENDFLLRFQIPAKVTVDEEESPVIFETVVDPDGRIRVHG